MNFRRKLALAAVSAAALLTGAPAAAHAAVAVSVTNDAGSYSPLTAGVPLGIHNIGPQVLVHVDQDSTNGLFSVSYTDQNGSTAALAASCYLAGSDASRYIDYHGNMAYNVTVTTYGPKDFDCATPKSTTTYQFVVGGVVAIVNPGHPLLERTPAGALITQALGFQGTPGAGLYEIKYALGGVVQPDGSLGGPVQDGYVDPTTGTVQLLATKPGNYVVVARAKSGDYYTPWSAPVTLRVLAPFRLTDSFPDHIGPRYTIRGKLEEGSARGGRVTLAAARGRKGGHFRTLGHGKINRHGVFVMHVTIHKRGIYRLRYTFKGRGTVAGGRVAEVVRIRRILV
jgi:hypothetical protein